MLCKIGSGGILLLFTGAPALSLALPQNTPNAPASCGSIPSDDFLLAAQNLAALEANTPVDAPLVGRTDEMEVIPTYFHILALDAWGTIYSHDLSNETVAIQIDFLNEVFNRHNFRFELAGLDRSYNVSWAFDEDRSAYQRALRKGGYTSLNIYMSKILPIGMGWYPRGIEEGSANWYEDGIIIQKAATVGSGHADFGNGSMLAHEVGHWLGLLHTFEGGCEERSGGDLIADTPAQASASGGCPIGRNSCPDKPGLDPIHNYMDYTSDICHTPETGFTPNQVTRMHDMWNRFRKTLQPPGTSMWPPSNINNGTTNGTTPLS